MKEIRKESVFYICEQGLQGFKQQFQALLIQVPHESKQTERLYCFHCGQTAFKEGARLKPDFSHFSRGSQIQCPRCRKLHENVYRLNSANHYKGEAIYWTDVDFLTDSIREKFFHESRLPFPRSWVQPFHKQWDQSWIKKIADQWDQRFNEIPPLKRTGLQGIRYRGVFSVNQATASLNPVQLELDGCYMVNPIRGEASSLFRKGVWVPIAPESFFDLPESTLECFTFPKELTLFGATFLTLEISKQTKASKFFLHLFKHKKTSD